MNDKNILIVVDLQTEFIQKEETNNIYEKIKKLLNKKLFDVVIYTEFVNNHNSPFETIPTDLLKHIDAIDTITHTKPKCERLIYETYRLNNYKHPKKIFIVGINNDCCLPITAIQFFRNNIMPIILTKYVASTNDRIAHKASLSIMKKFIGDNQLVNLEPTALIQPNV